IVGVGPTEAATGSFGSNLLSGRLEAGAKYLFGRVAVTPFAAGEFAGLWADGLPRTKGVPPRAPGPPRPCLRAPPTASPPGLPGRAGRHPLCAAQGHGAGALHAAVVGARVLSHPRRDARLHRAAGGGVHRRRPARGARCRARRERRQARDPAQCLAVRQLRRRVLPSQPELCRQGRRQVHVVAGSTSKLNPTTLGMTAIGTVYFNPSPPLPAQMIAIAKVPGGDVSAAKCGVPWPALVWTARLTPSAAHGQGVPS